MKCDFCSKEMDQNETGYFILEEKKGGHILCVIKYKEAKTNNANN